MQSITPQHVEEAISRAHVAAIAGAAGVLTGITDFDYKVDGTFEAIRYINGSPGPDGFPIAFQLKAWMNAAEVNGNLAYPLDAKTYNYMVGRNSPRIGNPVILVVCCLHGTQTEWVHINDERMQLKKACYWMYIEGEVSKNTSSLTVHIPKANLLTPSVLRRLLDSRENRTFYDVCRV